MDLENQAGLPRDALLPRGAYPNDMPCATNSSCGASCSRLATIQIFPPGRLRLSTREMCQIVRVLQQRLTWKTPDVGRLMSRHPMIGDRCVQERIVSKSITPPDTGDLV